MNCTMEQAVMPLELDEKQVTCEGTRRPNHVVRIIINEAIAQESGSESKRSSNMAG
jgi:hypothetical protein